VLALEGDKHVSLFFPPSACLALEYIALGLKPPLFLDAAQAAKELEVLKEQLTLRVETLEAQHNSSAEALSALEDTSELRAKLAATQQQLDDVKAMLTRLQGQFALHHDTLKTTQLAVGAACSERLASKLLGLATALTTKLDRKRPRSPSSSPSRSPSPAPACEPTELTPTEMAQRIKELEAAARLNKAAPAPAQVNPVAHRIPDMPKPPLYEGAKEDVVEDRLFVFENYLRGSKIPEDLWTNYVMPLLSGKALIAWTSVAVPAQKAGHSLTWELFKRTMLTNFAHPDRQHKAREILHKLKQNPGQHATDYVRSFNTLLQKAGDPAPCMADQVLFFHSGLLPFLKEKSITNAANGGKFWTDLQSLQEHVIAVQTHGTKQADLVPSTSLNFARKFARANAIQGNKPFSRPSGAKSSNKNKGGNQHYKREPVPAGKDSLIASLRKQLAEEKGKKEGK